MDEETLNEASTQTSTGTGWFQQLLETATQAGTAAYAANQAADAARANAAAARPASTPVNWTPIAIGGGVIALLLVLVFAFKK